MLHYFVYAHNSTIGGNGGSGNCASESQMREAYYNKLANSFKELQKRVCMKIIIILAKTGCFI